MVQVKEISLEILTISRKEFEERWDKIFGHKGLNKEIFEDKDGSKRKSKRDPRLARARVYLVLINQREHLTTQRNHTLWLLNQVVKLRQYVLDSKELKQQVSQKQVNQDVYKNGKRKSFK